MLNLFNKDKTFGYAELDRNHNRVPGAKIEMAVRSPAQQPQITKGAIEAQDTMR